MSLLNLITSYDELKTFIPALRKLYVEMDGKWEPDLTVDEFVLKLVDFFGPDNYYFGKLTPEGEIVYFAALLADDQPKAIFWLFFMNKDFRTETQQLLFDMSDFMMERGYHIIYSRTGRIERSYERWLTKFGAKKHEVVYKFNLKNLIR